MEVTTFSVEFKQTSETRRDYGGFSVDVFFHNSSLSWFPLRNSWNPQQVVEKWQALKAGFPQVLVAIRG